MRRWYLILNLVLLTFLLSAVAPRASAAYVSDVLALHPLNYWQLNESVSPAIDSGSNPQNGAYDTGITTALAGPRPSDGFAGMSIDNNAPDFVDSNTASEVNMGSYTPVTGTSPRTILAWINNSTLSGVDAIVNYGTSVTTGSRFRLQTNENQLGIDIFGVASLVVPSNPLTNLSTNTWQMVGVVVPSGATTVGDLVFYVDGNATSIASSASFSTVGGTDFRLGREPANAALNFDGRIDEVAVFDVALSGAQIQALYLSSQTAPLPAPEPSSFLLLGLGLCVLTRRQRGKAERVNESGDYRVPS